MSTQVYKITRYEPQPVLTNRTEPILDTSGLALTEKINLSKKDKGFTPPTHLINGLTFGVIGDDTNLYPSSHWQSEAQSRYIPSKSEKEDKQNFVITSLDKRAHNPQTTRIFHIKRINHEPVCQVLTWPIYAQQSGDGNDTVYKTSYPIKVGKEPRRLILRHSLEKRAEGIVPINPAEGFDVRNEMMLPVCDPVVLPSAPNPHRYLIRKRKVPAPTKPAGVIYPPLEPKAVRSADVVSKGCKSATFERVSVSTLAGDVFSRRKYIPPPLANMTTDNQVKDLEFWCISSVKGLDASRRRFIRPPSSRVDLASVRVPSKYEQAVTATNLMTNICHSSDARQLSLRKITNSVE